MSIMTVETTITYKTLLNKSKHDLADLCLRFADINAMAGQLIVELESRLAEYEGDNKRWHSFETVQALVKERDELRAQLQAAQREAARWEINYKQADAAYQRVIAEHDAAREDARALAQAYRDDGLILRDRLNQILEKYAEETKWK